MGWPDRAREVRLGVSPHGMLAEWSCRMIRSSPDRCSYGYAAGVAWIDRRVWAACWSPDRARSPAAADGRHTTAIDRRILQWDAGSRGVAIADCRMIRSSPDRCSYGHAGIPPCMLEHRHRSDRRQSVGSTRSLSAYSRCVLLGCRIVSQECMESVVSDDPSFVGSWFICVCGDTAMRGYRQAD